MNDLDSIFNEDWSADHKSGVVAVVGKPNVGKSTLINSILGQKIAIVSPTPQTTRRNQLGILTRDDVQILFVDTPGIHSPHHRLGEFMVGVAENALRDADVILWLVDVSANPQEEDKHIAARLQHVRQTPIVMVLNKQDQVHPEQLEARVANFTALLTPHSTVITSAINGVNVPQVVEQLVALLPLGPRYYPKEQLSDVNLRFIAAEIVRERVIYNTKDEIPHSVAIGIDSFEERENDSFHIHATIYVERESQKGIIIGNKGAMIKQVGTEARTEMKRVFEHDVQLFLHVKVLKNWRSDARLMRQFGYFVPKED